MPSSQRHPFLLLRYTLIVATAYLLLVEQGFVFPSTPVVLLITAALISNVVVGQLPDRITTSVNFGMLIIVYDTAWITAALLWSGRFSTEFFYVYFFVVLLAAIGENLRLIAVGAIALCVAYLFGFLITEGGSFWHSPSLIRLPFLFATAIFNGYLVDRTRQERRRADQGEALARHLARTLAELRVLHGKAQEADRTKADFLASISHELRTPLVALLGYVDLLVEHAFGALSAEQEGALHQAQRAGRTLHQLIVQVLDARRFEMQPEPLRCETSDLNAMLAELRTEFPSTDAVTLRCFSPVEIPPLQTDSTKVRTILRNLIENSFKYTPHGSVTVNARWDADRDEVEVRVRDTGIGIPPEDLPYIFEAFRRSGGATQHLASGVGLGLYIVKRLATLIGGDVNVESYPGGGSTFAVRFPRVIPIPA